MVEQIKKLILIWSNR